MLKEVDIEKAVKLRFPEPVALVVSKDKNGKVNLCPVGFFCLVAWEPKVVAVSLYEEHFTPKAISETREFVVCLPSIDQVEDVLYCGSVHGWETDKTKKVRFKFLKSKFVKPPLIDDSIACFECKVTKQLKVEDHILFLGKIVAAHESGRSWEGKIYNWDDKRLGTMKLGDEYSEADYCFEGSEEV